MVLLTLPNFTARCQMVALNVHGKLKLMWT